MHFLVILGAVVNLYGIAHYVRGIFHGKTKPNLVTWVLWAIAPLVASAAAFSTGVRWAALPTFMVGFCPLLVVISISITKHSIWQPTKFSYFCGALSLIALVLWAITRNPEIAVIFAILSDGLAAMPTLKKAWQYPNTELGAAYTATLFNILTSFSATHLYTFSEIGFPVYNTLLHVALSFAVYKRSFLIRANTPSID